jgi:hypothetical protein
MRRLLAAILLAGALAAGAVGPALAAASDQASCLGQGASGAQPGTKDDVAQYITAAARASGTTHGAIVSGFAQQHSGCPAIPPVPPHP